MQGFIVLLSKIGFIYFTLNKKNGSKITSSSVSIAEISEILNLFHLFFGFN